MPIGIELVRILFAGFMLSIASAMDLWKREVHDYLWIVFAIIAVILILFEENLYQFALELGFSLIIAPIAMLLWRFGFFGGADAFGIIVLVALAPMITLTGNAVSPLTILVNAAIFSLIPIPLNVIKNTILIIRKENIFEDFDESKFKKILVFMLGHKARQPRFSFRIEKKDGGSKYFDISFHHADTAEYCSTPNTWVTPGIPFILFITAGFFTQVFYGDIIFNMVNFVY